MVFYDGIAYWRYREIRDISSWIQRAYVEIRMRRKPGRQEAALFVDNTTLKQRLERIFGLKQSGNKNLDTLGMAVYQSNRWIVDNLRYPIAFLDGTLFGMLNDDALYGEKLCQYDAYFTEERCEWLRAQLPQADALARQAIMEAVGYDPDTTEHAFSRLPKGHYAPAFYSADFYLSEMQRGPRFHDLPRV
jgi:hypothetical protein